MAADNLPTEFDVVILGTGLAESVIAAACSRVGQRVLHIDKRNYYAGNWASFTFNGLLAWIEEYKEQQRDVDSDDSWREKLEEGEEPLLLGTVDTSVSNLQIFCYASEEPEEEEEVATPVATPTPESPATSTEEHLAQGHAAATEETDAEREAPPTVDTQSEATPTEETEAHGQATPTEETEAHGQATPTEETEAQSQATPINETEAQSQATPLESQTHVEPEQQVQREEPEGDQSTSNEGDSAQSEEPIPPSPVETKKKKITYSKILKEGRRFNIDLVSKLLYSRGSLVNLLIKSNVSRYAEFKNVSRILTYRNGKVEQVPCSRADVFGSKQLTVVEKRMLMKFLTFCSDYEQHPEEYLDFSERSFWEFLQTKKLTENLQHFVLHSIAMVTPGARTAEGLRATQHFLRCLGRYGNTPFLFPLYGMGEIPQCFCRMCAVFGGIYCLRHSVQCLVLDKESGRCKAVIDTCGQRISCSHFVVEEGYLREEQRKNVTYRQISRAVLITDRSLLPSESEQQISLVTVPPQETGGPAVQVIELCSSSMTCMPGTYMVHLTCPSSGTAQEDLAPLVSRLFAEPPSAEEEGEVDGEKPVLLWALYFNMRDSSGVDRSSYSLPSNVYPCTGPDPALGSDNAIALAEAVFQQLLPDEEFCPPAPNPEDIVYDGEGPQGEGAGFGEPVQPDRGGGQGEGEARGEGDGKEEQKSESEQDNEGSQMGVAAEDPPPAPPTEE
ncbi:rab proteins geranylgeranyltransferase component A 1 isoform X2 [Anguilla anguilla]|uniref:rab proteins geranylgeranyltransferase component A 1 isoform X2 n=1 Tax=Anguilla anguilla TaxID=7936 RepID=UPI0015AF0100|nr:rab proteins geranylgeranyltransferase component A 1 isoform X2 [Anguilla anguilla]